MSFLRKGWWLFPLLGVLAAPVLGGPFWQWVAGESPFPFQWQRIFSLRAGLLALGLLAIPALWRLGLNAKRQGYLGIPLGLLAVLAVEFLLRTPFAQGPLWLAAQARLDADQWYMREVCYVRLEEAAGRKNNRPSVVLMGSSQMLHGVDDHRLRELLNPKPVIRRSMYGLTPLKALAMSAYVPFQADDVCVQYLSEFDFTNQEDFPCDWFRPYASWTTLPDVLKCVSASVCIERWRDVVDYALAATFESWRARDFLGEIVFRFWKNPGTSMAVAHAPESVDAAARMRAGLRNSAAEHRAFRIFALKLAEREVKLLVFEGDVNPALHSPERLQAKAEVRRELTCFSDLKGYRYVSRDEQNLALGPDLWRDMTHLNPIGRDLLTRRMALELIRQ